MIIEDMEKHQRVRKRGDYIADKEGFDLLVEDVKELSDIIKKKMKNYH